MKFTTPCFIRKNTEELRKKLKSIGVCPFLLDEELNSWGDNIKVFGQNMVVFSCSDSLNDCKDYIDCGTNESLFLAIAALRTNTDKFQWFTDGYHWEKCPDEVAYINAWLDKYRCSPHKATVEELIEHFNMKNIQK